MNTSEPTGTTDMKPEVRGWVDNTPVPAPTATPVPMETQTIAVRVPSDCLSQEEFEEYAEKSDPVEAPSHYCRGEYELGPILYVWGLTHRRASAVEYIMRAGDKDPEKEVEDLRKAIRNIEMELEYMKRYGKVKQ